VSVPTPSFRGALGVWARIGMLGFGGPAGQIALMHRMLVEERGWIDETRFLHALNYCMLLPGPEAQQLATYVGWRLHGARGGLAAGLLFVLPGALVVLVLSALYAEFHGLRGVDALFFGLKPAVLAVVIEALLRIGRRALRGRWPVVVALAAFAAIFFLELPFPVIVLGAGLAGLIAGRAAPAAPVPEGTADLDPPARGAGRAAALSAALWLAPVAGLALALGPGHVFARIALFFSKAAIVTFGGAYSVLAYLAQQAVETQHWLASGEMLDGLGLAETTPGPLVLVTQFVGFVAAYRNPGALPPLAAGGLGALLTTWVTFAPCFFWVFLGAPYIERLRGRPALDAALLAITAAVVGVIANLSLWFALHVLFAEIAQRHVGPVRLLIPDWRSLDPAALALAGAALVSMLRLGIGMIPTLAASALAGAAWRLLG
jgi:chromate transporter